MMETAGSALVFALAVLGVLVLLGIAWRLFVLLLTGLVCGAVCVWEKTHA